MSPRPIPVPPDQDSSARKIKVPTTSGCKNWKGLGQWKEWLVPQAVPLKEPTHRLTYWDSELQHRRSSLKDTNGIQGESEVSGIKASRDHCPFAKPSPNRAGKLVPYLKPHQPG